MESKLVMEFDLYRDNKAQIIKPMFGALYKIKLTAGSPHKSLSGAFTSIAEAEKAIRDYMRLYMNVPKTSRNQKEKVHEKLQNQEGKVAKEDG